MEANLRKDNHAFKVDVSLALEQDLGDDVIAWGGTIAVCPNRIVEMGAHTLILADGRTGEIEIVKITPAVAYFIGTKNQP